MRSKLYRARYCNLIIVAVGVMLESLFFLVGSAAGFDVTACGQTVPAGETGVLQADLVCSTAIGSVGVTLGKYATLDLNGHTLSGGSWAVECTAVRCTIHGPGTISDSPNAGILVDVKVRRCLVSDVTLSDNGWWAINVNGHGHVILENVAIDRNFAGTTEVAEIGGVVSARAVDASNVTATGNLTYVFSTARLRGNNITLTDNYAGVQNGKVRVERFVVSGSTGPAIRSRKRVRLENSTLSNNGTGGDGVDLLLVKKPKLISTTCIRSQVCLETLGAGCIADNATWLVCDADF